MKNLLNNGVQSVSETAMVMVEGGCPVCQYPDMPPPHLLDLLFQVGVAEEIHIPTDRKNMI